MQEWTIHALCDPRDKSVRYVGWTFNTNKRLRAHVLTARRTLSHKANWLRSLLALGLAPELIVLERGNADWQAAERKWISHYRKIGARLTNMTDGGDGTPGCIPSNSTRHKMSAAQTGRKQSAESTARTRAALLGRKQTPEHIAALAAARKGKVPIHATIAAAKRNLGTAQSAEHIAKRISPLIGRIRPNMRRLTNEQVLFARSSTLSLRKIAAVLGVGQTIIHEIRHYLAYRDIPNQPTKKSIAFGCKQ